MSVRTAPPPPAPSGGRYHWTVDTFYRAMNAGVFNEPERLELVRGEIWERDVMNPPHAQVTDRVARLFRRLFEPAFYVREEKPLYIASDGEPVPDIILVAGDPDDYGDRHPTADEARLVVEVADSSVERDLGEKARLYAQAGIPDYWVSALSTRTVVVHRDPTPEGYASTMSLHGGDTVTPLFATDVTIAVADLLPRPTQ